MNGIRPDDPATINHNSPDHVFVIKAGNQLHLARDSLGELGAIWVEWNALHGIQTVIQFISNLKLKQKRQKW